MEPDGVNIAWRCQCGKWRWVGAKEWQTISCSTEEIRRRHLARLEAGVAPTSPVIPRIAAEFDRFIGAYTREDLTTRSYHEATTALLSWCVHYRDKIYASLMVTGEKNG